MSEFRQGDPHSGYYSDLTGEARRFGREPRDVVATFPELIASRVTVNPVSIVQLGLGAWQLQSREPGWREIVARAVDWVVQTMDERGGLAYLFPMPHTYELRPPWFSAMAQAEAASLLVRAARMLGDEELRAAAVRVAEPLLGPDLGLIARTPDGPVLQEYPTTPPAHVLNGWITALWGLYDVWHRGEPVVLESDRFRQAFLSGVDALLARLPLYYFGRRWSRYDLFPHPLPNVASPFYHRLHVEQLKALDLLAPNELLRRTADEWEAGLARPLSLGTAVACKVAFRVTRPRSRRIPAPWNIRRLS